MAAKERNFDDEIRKLHEEINNRIGKASPLLTYLKHRIEDYSSKRKFGHVVIQGSVGNNLFLPEILDDGVYRVEIDILLEQDSRNVTLPSWIADNDFWKTTQVMVEVIPDETVSSPLYVKLKGARFPGYLEEYGIARRCLEFDELRQEYYLMNGEYLNTLLSLKDEIQGGIFGEKELTTGDVTQSFHGRSPFRPFRTEIQQLDTEAGIIRYQMLMDKVVAIKVKWPEFASPWESRDRLWPPLDVCKAITQYGVHVIPKSSHLSESEVQWKYTFAIAEQRLAHVFTPHQKTCYLIFKQLKRRYFNQVSLHDGAVIISSGISTHHLKTIMFWTSEKISPNEWQANPGKCLSLLVETLVDFLQAKHCPSYFVPEVNLFERLWLDENKFLYVRDYDQLRDERLEGILELVRGVQSNIEEYMTSELIKVVDADHERAVSMAHFAAEDDSYSHFRFQMFPVEPLVSIDFPFTFDSDFCKSAQEEEKKG